MFMCSGGSGAGGGAAASPENHAASRRRPLCRCGPGPASARACAPVRAWERARAARARTPDNPSSRTRAAHPAAPQFAIRRSRMPRKHQRWRLCRHRLTRRQVGGGQGQEAQKHKGDGLHGLSVSFLDQGDGRDGQKVDVRARPGMRSLAGASGNRFMHMPANLSDAIPIRFWAFAS